MTTIVRGSVAPGWEPVQEAFQANFEQHGELGAGVCVHHRGKVVADLQGGVADPVSGRPYDEHTLQLVFSTTKGATAMCAALLVQRGLLDVEAPVASYWPEFKAAGKENMPVRLLLTHQAGLATIDKVLTREQALDWDTLCAALAEQAPLWEPGTAHGYHALTYGHLVGEVVRRISGKSLGTFFADEFAEPLGLEFWIGLPEQYEPRVAPLSPAPPLPPEAQAMADMMMGPQTLGGRALSLNGSLGGLDPDDMVFNTRPFHAVEIPAANGITNAKSLSRLYAACVGDVEGAARVLSAEVVDAFRQRRTTGNDKCLIVETVFGLGFMLDSAFMPLVDAGSFGHAGAGGSLGFASPDNEIGFGYVMNQMQLNLAGDPRVNGLIDAVRRCL